MKKKNINTISKKIAVTGVLSALAIVLGYIEYLIPLNFAIPGIKLGLANLAVLFALIVTDTKYAASVSLIKIVTTSLIFGNFVSFCYSLSGGFVSLAVMTIMKKTKN